MHPFYESAKGALRLSLDKTLHFFRRRPGFSFRLSAQGILIFSLFFLCSFGGYAQLWSEDFADEANGAQAGTAVGGTWSTSYSGSGTFSKENIPVVGEGFHVSGTTTEGIWSTNTVDITSVGYAIINLDVYSAFVEANDYIRIAYVLDGVEVIFYELIGGNGAAGLSIEAPASAIVAGNSLQIKVYSRKVGPGRMQLPGLEHGRSQGIPEPLVPVIL